MEHTQLPDGRWQRKPRKEDAPEAVAVYYMRDDHTFRPLQLDVEAAVSVLREEFDNGQSYGMLCGEPRGVLPPNVHAGPVAEWPAFEAAARAWVAQCIELSKPGSKTP